MCLLKSSSVTRVGCSTRITLAKTRFALLERQILQHALPFIHIAARNDYFEIINHLAHGQPTGNNDDAGNFLAFSDPVRCVIWHRAAIMSDNNTRLVCCPG